MKKPEVVTISQQEADSLIESIEGTNLSEEQKTLLVNMCYFFFWLQDQLQQARLSISNLKQRLLPAAQS